MDDPSKPVQVSPAQLSSVDGLGRVWNRFREGGVVGCAKDRAPLALAVDAAAGAYRFVCTECGASSPWFEWGPEGLVVRHATSPFAAGSTLTDE